MEQLHAMGDGENQRGRVTDRLCEVGTKFGKLTASFDGCYGGESSHKFREGDFGDTPFPYWLIVPQYRTEMILEEELELLGGMVE